MPEQYCCPRCGNYSLASLWNLTTWKYLRRDYGSLLNIAQERPERMWVCPLCFRTTSNEKLLRLQMNIKHSNCPKKTPGN